MIRPMGGSVTEPGPEPRWVRDPKFDLRALAIGIVVAGVLPTAGSYALRAAAGHGRPAQTGPTAATLDDGLAWTFGAVVGLMVGSAVTAAMARTGSRLATGVIAGAAGYLFIVV